MPELPTGTVTLLFTDIEGSTRMLQELGREAYVRALTEHRRLLREAFTSHGGVEVEMQGDSFFFAFPFARDAVAAAVDGQRALAEHAWEAAPITVRIGLHTGEPMQADGLYAGLDVHWAARVMSAAHGGQVVLSARTADIVTGELPDGISVLDLGQHRLKDLTAAQRLFQVGDGDFPPLKTLTPTSNLPVAASPLLGREAEVADLTELLRDDARVVTVTGTGGAGKTRLALQVAGELVEEFPDGVHWIPLAALTDPTLVLPTIAQTVDVRTAATSGLGERRTLLLLDNFEHLLEAAPAVSRLLATSPAARALVTSRAALQIDGEHEFALESLPDQAASVLFVERSRAAGARLDGDPTVTAICRRLDNLPLAIELAAARTKLLDPEALLDRLEHRLPLLTGGRRDAPERQRTLRATIDWSYQLLEAPTQELFAELAVFAGDFSLEAAEAVCEADLDALQALVDLSLLKPIGGARFLMLETIREYAAERLATLAEADAIHRRHAGWFAGLAHAQAEPARRSDREALETLAGDEHNFRSALAYSVAHDLSENAQRLFLGVWWFFTTQGYAEELERWANLVSELPPGEDTALRAVALTVAGEAVRFRGDHARSRVLKQQALPLLRETGEERWVAATLTDLSGIAAEEGDFEEAERLVAEALAIRERIGHESGVAHARTGMAVIAFKRGDFARARSLAEGTLPTWRSLGARADEAWVLGMVGACHRKLGDFGSAASYLPDAIKAARDVDMTVLIDSLREVGAVVLGRGDARAAAAILGGVSRMYDETGMHVDEPEDFERLHARLRESLPPDELEVEWQRGAALEQAELIELALGTMSLQTAT